MSGVITCIKQYIILTKREYEGIRDSMHFFLPRMLGLLLASGSCGVVRGGGKDDKRKHLFFLIHADKCLNRLLNWEMRRRERVSSTCCGTFSA